MNSASNSDRRRLARRLHVLTQDLTFTWGACAENRGDDAVQITIDRVWANDQPEHLVTVFAGFPPGPLVRGLPWTVRQASSGTVQRAGQTDRRGQFRLRGLVPGDYMVRVEGLVVAPALGKLPRVGLAAASADEVRAQDYISEDGSIQARLQQSSSGRWLLEVTLVSEAIGDGLARYRVWDEAAGLLAEGFVGLYPLADSGTWFGEVFLPAALSNGLSSDHYLLVAAQPTDMLVIQDRDPLLRSIQASDHPSCRAALQEALRHLPQS